MKPGSLLLLSLLLTLLQNDSLGQSMFALDNYQPSFDVDAPVSDAEGNPLTGSDYTAELWGAAAADSLAPTVNWQDWSLRVMASFRTDLPGYFHGTQVVVLDVPPSGYAWLQVRAWDARLGSTYEKVEALGIGGYGESPVFYAQGNDPTRVPPELPAPLIGLESFSLRPIIPEPSIGALLALSGPVLWRARQRRWRR